MLSAVVVPLVVLECSKARWFGLTCSDDATAWANLAPQSLFVWFLVPKNSAGEAFHSAHDSVTNDVTSLSDDGDVFELRADAVAERDALLTGHELSVDESTPHRVLDAEVLPARVADP